VELQPAAPKISRLDPLQEHQSLVRTAELLKRTFRTGDLLAHLGENLFVVLAMGANRDIAGSLRVRLQQNLAEQNSRSGAASPLTLKVGVSLFNPKAPTSLNELLAEADRALFAQG
jgi:diguanylate cyclase (GGDEF)-like protein